MAGECKFEKNLLEVSNCQAASTTFNTIYLWMWKEMVGVQINSLLIILQCSPGLGERARPQKK